MVYEIKITKENNQTIVKYKTKVQKIVKKYSNLTSTLAASTLHLSVLIRARCGPIKWERWLSLARSRGRFIIRQIEGSRGMQSALTGQPCGTEARHISEA